jgi:hypothetical protein
VKKRGQRSGRDARGPGGVRATTKMVAKHVRVSNCLSRCLRPPVAEKRAGRPRSRWGSSNDEDGSETRESFELPIPVPSSSRCREAGGTPAVRHRPLARNREPRTNPASARRGNRHHTGPPQRGGRPCGCLRRGRTGKSGSRLRRGGLCDRSRPTRGWRWPRLSGCGS